MADKVLCVDMGNSRIKWQFIQLETMKVDEYRICSGLSEFESWLSGLKPVPVWVSAVCSDQKKDKLRQWFLDNWQQEPVLLGTEKEFDGLTNGYRVSTELGVDRWLAMIAARSLIAGDICIIDAGTAVTVDVVLDNGKHQGGLISPGLQLMISALNKNTANIDITAGNSADLANNTADAVVGGVMNCWLGGIERAISEIKAQLPEFSIVITGGDAHKLEILQLKNASFEKDLVLMGIGLVARKFYA